MSMWSEARATARAQFVDALEQRRFAPTGPDTWAGSVEAVGRSWRVRVRIDGRFPFAPPSVFPPDEVPSSWHRDRDGAMCLYPGVGREALPWLDVEDFLATVGRWLAETVDGWTRDSPDLDLQRYFEPSPDLRLVLYGDLDRLIGRSVELTRGPHTVTVKGVGAIPARATRVVNGGRAFGYVADIGEPAVPPRTWDQIVDLLHGSAGMVAKSAREGRIQYLLLRYQRQGRPSVLALDIVGSAAGVTVRAMDNAPMDAGTLMLRGGRDASVLRGKHVLVVGAGSVGSHVCDALARAGVGHLTIRDGSVLRPGNLIRHIADFQDVGRPKAVAVADTIHTQRFNQTRCFAAPDHLLNPAEVPDLLDLYDLVIDATADASASAMLATAARATGIHILSVCLQADGQVVRVDIVPPLDGADPIPEAAPHAPAGPDGHEAGCGEPVSLTPPYAVAEAAGVAARHAVAVLTGTPLTPAGECRDHR